MVYDNTMVNMAEYWRTADFLRSSRKVLQTKLLALSRLAIFVIAILYRFFVWFFLIWCFWHLVFGIVYLVLIITSSSPCFRTSNVSQFTKCAQYTFLQLETHRWLGGNKKSSQPYIFIANDFNQWNNCSFLPIQQPNSKKNCCPLHNQWNDLIFLIFLLFPTMCVSLIDRAPVTFVVEKPSMERKRNPAGEQLWTAFVLFFFAFVQSYKMYFCIWWN